MLTRRYRSVTIGRLDGSHPAAPAHRRSASPLAASCPPAASTQDNSSGSPRANGPRALRTPRDLKGRHMARALLGYVGNGNEQVLAIEVARLRRRVAELEAELTELRNSSHAEMEAELHRFAESIATSTAPALA